MSAVLQARDVHAYYGKSHILHGVSLELDQGEIVTVLGRNGAGKPAYAIARLGVGYVPEGRKIFGNLTVQENLIVPQARPGPWSLDRVFTLFPRLGERRGQLGRQLSGGEQEMLAIARPLLLNPRIMLLDEPSQGLAPLVVQEVMNVVRTMRNEGLSVLLVEQNVPLSLGVADRAYILDDGKVVYSGTAVALAAEPDLVQKLAGATAQH